MAELKKTKKEIVDKAKELGVEYETKYQGCGQCTFCAIIDALRWGGLELLPEDMQERLFCGLTLLSGGVAMTGEGSCGGVTGGVLAIGVALGISREMQAEDRSVRRVGYETAWRGIVDKYFKKYNSLLCKDVQRKSFGKAYDLRAPEVSKEFLRTSGVFDISERTPERAICLTHNCTIAVAAGWATECILDEFYNGNLKGKHEIL